MKPDDSGKLSAMDVDYVSDEFIVGLAVQPSTRLNVVCIKWGTKYPAEYVNRLYRMVARQISLSFRFICFTDDAAGVEEPVECLPIPDSNLEGWWTKMSLFRPGVLTGTCLYLDLDVVIVGRLDELALYGEKHEFAVCRDFLPANILFNSSVKRFDTRYHSLIWDEWVRNRNYFSRLHSDQEAISVIMQNRPYTLVYPSNWVFSYKWTVHEVGGVQQNVIPRDGRVAVFHGKPDPHEVATPWVIENWR